MTKAFIIILLLLTKCTSDDFLIEGFKRIKHPVDKTIPSKRLNLIKSIRIEENQNLILSEILGADISPDGKKLLIADLVSKTLNLYDNKTGKIIKFLQANIFLNDSIASSNKNKFLFNCSSYRALKSNEYKKYGFNDETQILRNMFMKAKFINNDKIYALALIYPYSVNDAWQKLIHNTPVIAVTNGNLKLEKVIVFEVQSNQNIKTKPDMSYPIPFRFILDKKEDCFYIISTDYSKQKLSIMDPKLPAVAKYDLNGNYIKKVLYLPESYMKSKGGYTLPHIAYINEIDNQKFFAFRIEDKIYNIDNKIRFKLKNLPYTNDSGFVYYKKVAKFSRINHIADPPEILKKIFPFRIFWTFTAKNHYNLVELIFDSTAANGDYYYILQEYTTKGKLLSQTIINDDLRNPIKYITFDNKNNYLVIFKKSKKGWTMEKRQWL